MKNNQQNTEALFGAHPIIEALKAKKRKLISIYTTKPTPKAFERVKQYLPKSEKYTINYVPKEALSKICGSAEHMGIVAWMGSFVYQKSFFTPEKHSKILILDSIQDVRNLGAILRSAYCTDFTGVVLCQGKSAKLSPAAIKASAGLAEHLSVFLATSITNAVEEAKKAGYNIYMATITGEDIRIANPQKPACLVIGNEEKGISKAIAKLGQEVLLPQKSCDISYNASVAAGILMFYLSFM